MYILSWQSMNLKVLLTRNDCTIEFYIKKKNCWTRTNKYYWIFNLFVDLQQERSKMEKELLNNTVVSVYKKGTGPRNMASIKWVNMSGISTGN